MGVGLLCCDSEEDICIVVACLLSSFVDGKYKYQTKVEGKRRLIWIEDEVKKKERKKERRETEWDF